MTETHHADTRGEAARLRRLGTGLVTDSFGEARWMGALANTRGLGDVQFKPFGVTPEPEVRSKVFQGRDWSFTVLISDGISSLVSDDEVVDLVRDVWEHGPQRAAQAVLRFAEEMGSEDNASVLVVPLPGWGSSNAPDHTKALREFRQSQLPRSNRQRRM